MALLTSVSDIEQLRISGHILAEALAKTAAAVRPGLPTLELDIMAEQVIHQAGGTPAFLGFEGFPASLCVSINTEVVHGIPTASRQLAEGDIVGLDLGVNYQGFFTDAAVTVPVGRVKAEAARLIDITQRSLTTALAVVRPGGTIGDIGAAIQSMVEPLGLGVIRQLTGHGVGRAVHEEPKIPNWGRPGTGPKLQMGMVLAIEPMLTAGKYQVETLEDGWTVVTSDGSLAAHFEHTVLVTEGGVEIITKI